MALTWAEVAKLEAHRAAKVAADQRFARESRARRWAEEECARLTAELERVEDELRAHRCLASSAQK